MKKTLTLLFALIMIIGCVSLPVAAYSSSTSMTTFYYDSNMVDQAHVEFTNSGETFDYVHFYIGLRGSDYVIRGKKTGQFLFKGSASEDSYNVDHDFDNSPHLHIY